MELKAERVLHWVQKGTETTRRISSSWPNFPGGEEHQHKGEGLSNLAHIHRTLNNLSSSSIAQTLCGPWGLSEDRGIEIKLKQKLPTGRMV